MAEVESMSSNRRLGAAEAQEGASSPRSSMTKRLFDRSGNGDARQTEDFREGVAAFLEKRPPGFSGR